MDSFVDDFDPDDLICPECNGQGGYHDCGEDACCCTEPCCEDDEYWFVCEACGGAGYV